MFLFRSKSKSPVGKGSDSEGEKGEKRRHSSHGSSSGSDIVRARKKYGAQSDEPRKFSYSYRDIAPVENYFALKGRVWICYFL